MHLFSIENTTVNLWKIFKNLKFIFYEFQTKRREIYDFSRRFLFDIISDDDEFHFVKILNIIIILNDRHITTDDKNQL